MPKLLFNTTTNKSFPHRYEFKGGDYIEVDEDYLEIYREDNSYEPRCKRRYYSCGLSSLIDEAIASLYIDGVNITTVSVSLSTEMTMKVENETLHISISDGSEYNFRFIMNNEEN